MRIGSFASSRSSRGLHLAVPGLALLLFGCGASNERARMVSHAGAWGDAYAKYEHSHERADLAMAAEGILTHLAVSPDAGERAAAFSELSAAGHGARPLLSYFAADHSPHVPPITRGLALRALMQLGDADARARLRALADAEDPRLVDLAYAALDADRDRVRLLDALQSPRTDRRQAALAVLAAHADARVQPALADAARRDPLPAIRAAAINALARLGSGAADAISAGLEDRDQSVRLAAIAALVRAAGATALPRVSHYLDGKLGPESVETARALLLADVSSELTRSRQALALALEAKDSALRARVALIYQTLPSQHRDQLVLKAALLRETVLEVRLALCLALGAADADAHKALQALQVMPVVVGVQAAGVLARLGNPASHDELVKRISSPLPAVRKAVARTLGAELGDWEKMSWLMRDPDSGVSRAAASAVLHLQPES